MSPADSQPVADATVAATAAQVQALRRVALAVAHPGGPTLFPDLVMELAAALEVAHVFVAVFADESRAVMRTLGACLDGAVLRNVDYRLQGSPCEAVVGRSCQYTAHGMASRFGPGTFFAKHGMDSFAAFPLNDSNGEPLGLLVAMDRKPIAGGDAAHAEAMLKIIAGRLAADIERSRTDDVLKAVALAVSGSRGASVFDELVRLLATILHVEVAFIARHEAADPSSLRILAMYNEGQILRDITYPVAGTPCETVLGQVFRAYPDRLQARFPDDEGARAHCTESYAGHPLAALDGSPLGVVSVASRRVLAQVDRVEAMLKIFAMRTAAEIERLQASEALQRSEASYRAIFEASEDAIFIHDWHTGHVLDANTKACQSFGYTLGELKQASLGAVSSGIEPFTARNALRRIRQAKLGRCPPFEWHRRNKDGSLHWDEVRLYPAMIDGRPHILAFLREITAQKQALEDLRLREEQYRAIFESSLDALFMWDENLRVVDVNPAGLALYGYRRDEIVGRGYPRSMPAEYVSQRQQIVRRAIAGETTHMETTVLRPDGSSFDADLRVMPFVQRGQRHALAVVRDISERRRRERELQRSEARLRATVEAAFDCVVGMDSEGRLVEFNAAAERVLGYRRADVLGRPMAQVLLPERYRAAHLAGVRNFRLRADGPMVGRLVETMALRADGTEIPVELAIGVAEVPEGSIFVGHLRDITERRRADRALRDSEEQYRAIFNASADALVLRAADFSIVDVNATYETMSGFRRSEVLGVDRVLANPPEVAATIRALHERALAGEAVSMDTELVRRDGKRYHLELRGVPIQHRGQPHVLYIGRDITQAKRAELALRASEEQYRAIFNASADALVLRDETFRAVEVNPAYTTMSGYSREEVMAADTVLTQADAEIRERHRKQHDDVLAGKEVRFEVTATRKDGSTLPVEVRATPMMYRGRPHVLYAVRDATERTAAEQRRAELERQLRQAQKMEAIGQLTGGLAHDFNNILTSVIGYVGMAQERPAASDDAALARQLAQARLAAERARDHVAQLLAFSRPQRGERRLIGATHAARQALQLLRPSLPSSIAVECSETGDSADGAVPPVVADPVQLEQVLFNLCINARDAIRAHGTIRVRIGHSGAAGAHCASCSARIDGTAWVWVEVADDGCGMPPEVLERMFEPFFTTKEVGRGTGMGLAMVHGIVHDHGGHIEATSTPGQGSAFRVLLPAASEGAWASAPAPQSPSRAGSHPALHGRVLLVEDEAMVSVYMVELLTGWGLEVVAHHDPHAAAERLAGPEPFDLLLTDQTMPGMTGLALCAFAKAQRPSLPVLVYTGNASEMSSAELDRCGASALLRKPIDAARLRTLVREALAHPGIEEAAPAR